MNIQIDQMDAKTFTLILAGTMAVVAALKGFLPKWMDKKEEIFAGILPVLFTVTAKLLGGFKATGWVDALLCALGGGVGSGVGWDYLAKPIFGKVKALFAKKEETKPLEEVKP